MHKKKFQSKIREDLVDDSFANRNKLRACYCKMEFRLSYNKAHSSLAFVSLVPFHDKRERGVLPLLTAPSGTPMKM